MNAILCGSTPSPDRPIHDSTPAKEDPISVSPTGATTAAALAALRRMSFAVVDAADRHAIHRTLAAELLGVFAVDAVHVCEVTADRSGASGTAFARREDGSVQGGERT